MALTNELQKLGFEEKEIQVYLACLELGEPNIQQISRKSGIKRTTVYDVVEALKTKGLLSSIKKDKKVHFYAEDPRSLVHSFEEKKESLTRLLPELLSIANFLDAKPKIRYFEGDGGIKEIYRDHLRHPGIEMLAWGSEKAVENFDADFLNNHYVPSRVKNRIFIRAIATDNEIWREYKKTDVESLRKLRLIPDNSFPIAVEIDLYGTRNISVLSFEEKVGLIIESEKIYATLKSIFEMNWMALSD